MIWIASEDIQQILAKVKAKHHSPRLDEAKMVVCFEDSKPFKKNRFNWGKTRKFSPALKLFLQEKYDFYITLSEPAFHEVLNGGQREAWIDLHLECCQAEMEPEVEENNGKKKPIKDEWGRIVYTDQMKRNEDAEPIWKVDPIDAVVIQANLTRFGCWCEEFNDLGEAILNKGGSQVTTPPLELDKVAP